jgi:hypothetical protein
MRSPSRLFRRNWGFWEQIVLRRLFYTPLQVLPIRTVKRAPLVAWRALSFEVGSYARQRYCTAIGPLGKVNALEEMVAMGATFPFAPGANFKMVEPSTT